MGHIVQEICRNDVIPLASEPSATLLVCRKTAAAVESSPAKNEGLGDQG